MTKELTAEELETVAREVTGRDYRVIDKLIAVKTEKDRLDYVWMPAFHDVPLQRSQALAVVEWLADKALTTNAGSPKALWWEQGILSAVHKRDIASLQKMVLELHGDTAP